MMSTRTVVITGGLGNLGTKLCRHLLRQANNCSSPPPYRVILVEHPAFIDSNRPLPHDDAIVLPCDLGNPSECQRASLADALSGADVLVHFSAVNPYPNATWSESAQTMDHAFYVFQLAIVCKVRRVILASSNHVMGGYKDDPAYGPSSIFPHSDPRVGTVPLNPNLIASSGDGRAYAAAKLAAERLAMTLGELHGETTTFVVLRIGWCQPGPNSPTTLSAAGSPPEYLLDVASSSSSSSSSSSAVFPEQSEDDARDEAWYKRMWLSNRDFLSYFEAAMDLDVPTKDSSVGEGGTTTTGVHRNVRRGFVLVNAMSRNRDAKWNLDDTEKLLGVVSTDDSMA
ncbi:hypothetical protein ACHAXA_011633 [Cyclostephanos tholiformis]|uniref:NAD-dependent epimerase/dehydratase domain-containing protein n=1 Tax=Cyclostephanos tholiformis TaxID=382380 RepID=A0ABD3RV94_9STRA